MSWTSVVARGNAPKTIWHHSAGSYGNGRKVVVFGGDMCRNDPEFTHIGDRAYAACVYILDVDTLYWSRVHTKGHIPSWRSLHTGIMYNSVADGSERFVIFGGCTEHLRIFTHGKPSDMRAYSLNLSTMRWQRGGEHKSATSAEFGQFIPQARMRFAAERYGLHVLVYGGHGEGEFNELASAEPVLSLNLKTLEWKTALAVNDPHSFAFAPAGTLAGGCLVLLLGASRSQRRTTL
eukprot:TRINITY_DN24888_c0_g2_i2.p1 TRINITY_DN24888_c0_g2~~TRINITY_DN24888_c0_g2_i2.p1  ORF type:complete len:262 (-),score=11.32 TRINITY_DN24888_c0_g2_i2:219-923(-)